MSSRLIVLFAVLGAAVVLAGPLDLLKDLTKNLKQDLAGLADDDTLDGFSKYCERFQKRMDNQTDARHKLENFKAFRDLAKRHQKEERGDAIHGETKFADFSPEEFIHTFTGHRARTSKPKSARLAPPTTLHSGRDKRSTPPASLDYRNYGVVTSVKNQGQCGDCYAFASMAMLETSQGLYFGNSNITNFSEAEITDCSFSYGNGGCNGGVGWYVFDYVMAKQVTNEATYPFVDTNQHTQCKLPANSPRYAHNLWGTFAPDPKTEAGVTQTLWDYGPMYIAIDANSLQTYQSGILNPSQPAGGWSINHAVLLIGYGTANGQDYWIAKNSWGTNWGESGYFRFRRGTNCLGVLADPMAVAFNY